MAANATVSLTIRLRDLVTGPATGMKKAFGGIRSSFERLGKTFDFAGKVGFAAGAVNQLGSQARGALTSILDPALRFEDTMARVGALTSGVTAEGVAKLTETAREMGRVTRYTAQEAAEGLAQLAIAGYDAEAQIAALPAVLKLTQASGAEMGRVADITSDLMGAFGKEAKDTGEIAGTLAATFSSSTTTLETLFETMKLAAPIATQAGVSMQQTATLIGLLGNSGVKGSQAGTALRGVMLSLVAPTKKARGALQGLGLTSGEIEKNLNKPATLIKKMADAFASKNFSNADKLRVINDVFGRRQATGAAILIDGVNKIGKDGKTAFDRLAGAVGEGEGALDRIAKTMDSTRLAGVRRFQSAMESLKIDLATELAPTFESLTKDLTKLVGNFAGWARENPGLVRGIGKILVGTVAFSAVLGPLLLTVSSLASAFAVLKGVFLGITVPVRVLGGAYTDLTNSMIKSTKATGKMGAGLRNVQAAVGLVGAAFAGWEVGKYLDEAIGKTLSLRGELLSTELAISAGESRQFNDYMALAGEIFGSKTLTEVAAGNRARNNIEQGVIAAGREGIGRGRGESRVEGRIELSVTDERIKVKKVARKAGPDLDVGVSSRTP